MEKLQRITNFRKLGLGFFIHFGLYNELSKGEWYQNMYNLTTEEYYKEIGDLSKKHLSLDVKNIVKTAKENGVNYIVLTTKHHDGFCLFNSNGISKWDITHTKNKEDIVKIFLEECKKQNIKAILYFATLDWSWDEEKINFPAQLQKINESVELLCQKYDNIYGFWFDGNWSRKEENWEEEKLYKIIRKYIPQAIIINNSGLTNAGKEQNIEVDTVTFEQGHLESVDYSKFKRDLAAEACQSFNDHWGFAAEDYNFKTPRQLIEKFLKLRSYRANLLLNISIQGNGQMVPLELELIKMFAKWIKKYAGELFEEYEVVSRIEKDFIIKTASNKYYAYLFDLPSGGHVKTIQAGGKIQQSRTFTSNEIWPNLKNAFFTDGDETTELERNGRNLTIIPTAFNYGFNTIAKKIILK